MGGTSYSVSSRSTRATTNAYHTKGVNEIFTQNVERKAHESMKSQGITIREARDSDVHPNTIPIIIGLDLTGSMGHIPHELVKDGLPTLVSGIIQNGISSPALLFLGIGDHETDREPLQVGQFESGDKELDMWLTRTYIEGGGGGNGGESYSLAHYFAARHCVTDHFEKRNKKGFLITIGDEPNLRNYPSNAMGEIMDNGDIATFSDAEILAEAQKKWHVYHILPGKSVRGAKEYWNELLGENSIWVDDFKQISNAIKNLVCKEVGASAVSQEETVEDQPTEEGDTPEKGSGVML